MTSKTHLSLCIKKPPLLLAIFSLNLLLAGTTFVTAAHAGGDTDNSVETEFYEPSATDDARYHVPPSSADIQAAASVSAPTQPAPTTEPTHDYSHDENIRSLEESEWSEIHTEDGVCREASGDVICFESGSAENVGW